jgi:hypothetical protein
LNKKYYLVREVLVQEGGRRRKREKLKRLVCILAAVILVISILPMCTFKAKAETQSVPTIEDPTPDYFETSSFLIGRVAVGVIFVESNGTIDPDTPTSGENWTTVEQQNVMDKIQYALNWWANQNPDANVSFVYDVHTEQTGYEPITRRYSDEQYWTSEIMASMGFPQLNRLWLFQTTDYVNALRDKFCTDWSFTIFVVNAANDFDGLFADGWGAYVWATREAMVLPVKSTNDLDWRVAHEFGHVFFATDEYDNFTNYDGYLNVSDISNSNSIMDNKIGSWKISGKPQGLNGTWGQVGWRDSNGNGVQDVVDTPQRVYLNPYTKIGNRFNFTGVAAVTPTENKLPWIPWYQPRRNVTINKVESVQYRVNGGGWLNASVTPTEVKKTMSIDIVNHTKETFVTRETTAIVNFTFLTPELSPGNHTIEIRATNQWGISGYANQTVTIPTANHDVAITSINPYRSILGNNTITSINIIAANQGDTSETFNVTLDYNSTTIGTQKIALSSQTSTNLTFHWNTTSIKLGNYTITATASPIQGETETSDNTLTYSTIRVSINGDINADGKVNILDITLAATAYGTNLGHPKWNALADMDENGIINIIDITAIAKQYGRTG